MANIFRDQIQLSTPLLQNCFGITICSMCSASTLKKLLRVITRALVKVNRLKKREVIEQKRVHCTMRRPNFMEFTMKPELMVQN